MLRYAVSLVLLIALSSLPALAAEGPEKPMIDTRADQVLRQMSDHLGALQQFTFHAENTTDTLLTSGQKLQFAFAVDAAVRRPDRLRALVEGDNQNKKFFYDGKSVVLLDTDSNYYGKLEGKATMDETLDYALNAFALKAPLSELLYSNAYRKLTENVETGFYLGLHRVHGVQCHHLAFTQQDMDWQLWIENGEKPWPRKLVITAKRVAGAPQFTALISNWETGSELPDPTFTFVAPEGSEMIEFLPTGK